MAKEERYITQWSREVDPNLARALGEMVVAFGRLEDMFKVAIKRAEGNKDSLEVIVNRYSGPEGNLGRLIQECKSKEYFANSCSQAKTLNTDRQDFIHATFAAQEDGSHIRFRKLVGYTDLAKDIERIQNISNQTNSLIEKLDNESGALLANKKTDGIIAVVSAAAS